MDDKKQIEQKQDTNDSVNVLLTPELYGNILEEKSIEMKRLKALQESELQTICEKTDSLSELETSLKSLKKHIRFSKRALRKEKRKLRKINKSLDLETNLIIDLNNSFKSQQKKYIKLSTFSSKKYQ